MESVVMEIKKVVTYKMAISGDLFNSDEKGP